MCALPSDKLAAHEESIKREMEASERAGDIVTSNLHLKLAELHRQQAQLLQKLPFGGDLAMQ